MTTTRPWHGVLVATALPLRPTGPGGDLDADSTRTPSTSRWLADNGCDGVVPERFAGRVPDADRRGAGRGRPRPPSRRRPAGFTVMPGVGGLRRGRGAAMGRAGGRGGRRVRCMLLPPNAYRADERAVVEHYREVAKVGLPIVAYNNPYRHQGRPHPRAAGRAARRGPDRRGQGVQRRRPAGLRDRRARARPRPARRRRRRASSSSRIAGAVGLGRRLPQRAARARACELSTGPPARRPGHRPAALPRPAPAAALGLPDRVRPGDQAVDGRRRPLRRPVPAAAAAAAARAGARRCARPPRSRARRKG